MLTVDVFSVNIEVLVLLCFRKFTACAEPEQTLVASHPGVGACSSAGMTAAEGYSSQNPLGITAEKPLTGTVREE